MPNLSAERQSPELLALGDAIKARRKSCGISQARMAEAAGIDRSYYGRIERGDNNGAVLMLHRIAIALDMTLADLIKAAGL